MSCPNKVEVWVEKGFHGKMVELNCGMTNHHGTRTLCADCEAEAHKKYPQGWQERPGDTCKHGVWLNPEHDCNCFKCENGDPSDAEYIFEWVRTGPLGEGSCSHYDEAFTDEELSAEIADLLKTNDAYGTMDFLLEIECLRWERMGVDTLPWYEARKELFREMHEYRTEFDMAIELWKDDKITIEQLKGLFECYGVRHDLQTSIIFGGKEKPYNG